MNDRSDELERVLIRSALLDVPSPAARERTKAAGLAALSEPRRRTFVALGAVGAALAMAAAAALCFRALRQPSAFHAEPERMTSVSPAHSALAGADASASAPPPCVALVVARGDAPLVEDWETHDSVLLRADGRSGTWVTYDDGTGKQSQPARSALFPSRIPGGRGRSKHALHLTGGRFTDWGVTFGAELADAACYDASAYEGVSFWAKGPGEIRVGLQMIDLQEVKYGGLCQHDCYDTHRKIVELDGTFREYRVRWDELRQLNASGTAVRFDPKRVRFLEFGIAPESTPFDVWVDDVAFVRSR